MRVTVTGASGQLGVDLVRILQKKFDVVGLSRNDLDITDSQQCKHILHRLQPDVVIHAAAYTNVDLAESEEDKAYAVNAFGTRNVAVAAEEIKAKFCFISTDYVFDGTGKTPYKEYDTTNPLSVYGKSKRVGEQLTQTLCSRYFIVRTSWVYGQFGNNFVKTILRLADEKDTLKVVSDQIGSPTYTIDLSDFLTKLIQTEKYGIYHASNAGHCSWYEFAKAILEENGKLTHVTPCLTTEFPRPAPRPNYSIMDHLSIRANGFDDLRHWRDALHDFFLK